MVACFGGLWKFILKTIMFERYLQIYSILIQRITNNQKFEFINEWYSNK